MTTIIKRDGTRIYEVAVPQTGQIAFYRDYKEPLVPLDRGFGYEGVLLYDISLQKVQCHFCGEWLEVLGNHIKQHGLNAKSYKDEYGLLRSSALTSERLRLGMSERASIRVAAGTFGVVPPGLSTRASKAAEKVKSGRTKAEFKNRHGTCAAQLLAWVTGHPSARSSTAPDRIEAAIRRTFGSWNKARALAGLSVNNLDNSEFDKTLALAGVRVFYQSQGRAPTGSDAKRGLLPYEYMRYWRHIGKWTDVLKEAGVPVMAPGSWNAKRRGSTYAEYAQNWAMQYRKGVNAGTIARSAGTTSNTVLKALREVGVRIRAPRRGTGNTII